MSSFAPVYRPPPLHQSFLAREQKRERKRKREANHSDEDDVARTSGPDLERLPEPGLKDEAQEESSSPRVPHPVNNTDPFYVAGLSREDSLPGGDFPHAPLPKAKPKLAVEQELARLNPPIYFTVAAPDTQDGSLRRRHLDNVTAVLHKCMLSGDWKRASRAWGLILRTEIQGRGVDVRHNNRWLVGGEILMRRGQHSEHQRERPRSRGSHEVLQNESGVGPVIADEGFRLVREYYERLTLQYPHMPRQSSATVNALAVYPALFNVWIFEVHDRALRARQQLERFALAGGSETGSISGESEKRESAAHRRGLRRIAALELEQAIPIAQRMDDIMLNPPYDESQELLHLRSMVSLWLSEVYQISTPTRESDASPEEDSSLSDLQDIPTSHRRRNILAKEQTIAKRIMISMLSAKMEIPHQLRTFVEGAEPEDDE